MQRLTGSFLLLCAMLNAQDTWYRCYAPAEPEQREAAAMAYDSARRVVVLFGGQSNLARSSHHLDDTWEWDGSRWRRLNLPTSPSPRRHHAMVYDEARKVIVLFGGQDHSSRLPDTWEFDGTAWRLRHVMGTNQDRFSVAMSYDPRRRRVMRFGGAGAGGAKDDTWVWDGTTWALLQASGPPGRFDAQMAYDALRDRTVLYGGSGASGYLSDTWEFDGVRWSPRFPAANPGGVARFSMVYDGAVARMVLFGGLANLSRVTWSWDGTNWSPRNVNVAPPARYDSAMAYDAHRDRVVMFSGWPVDDSDTWEYHSPVRRPAVYSGFGTGCAGSAGVPRLAALPRSLPFVGAPFELELSSLPTGVVNIPFGLIGASKSAWGSIPLPLDLGPFQMPGCKLFVSHDWIQPIPKNGATASWVLNVPYDTTLVGQRFFVQGAVADAKANGAGFVWSNAGEALIGER